MRTKLIRESLSHPFDERYAKAVIKSYLPYLSNKVTFLGSKESEEGLGFDEEFKDYALFSVKTGIPSIDEYGVTLVIGIPFDFELNYDEYFSGICIKFYADAIAFVPGSYDDEYTRTLDPYPIENFTEDRWKDILRNMKKVLSE